MDDQVFLAWNLPNWITVILMVALGYLAVALVWQLLIKRGGGAFGNFGGMLGTSGKQSPGASLLYGGQNIPLAG